MLIEGEAGIGKSHLLTSLNHAARSAGMTVIEVAADEVARRPGDVAHVLAADERLPATHRSQLRDLLNRTAHHGDVEDLSYAVIERCADALEVLTRGVAGGVARRGSPLGRRPVARGHPSSRPAHGVVDPRRRRRPPAGAPTCAARPCAGDGGEGRRPPPASGSARRARRAGALGRAHGAAPGERLRDRLQATGGNPLFVSELLRSFEEEQHLRIEAGVAEISDSAVPANLGATLIRRLSWLPEGTRDLLRLASLLGTSFTLTELSALTGRTVVEVASGCGTPRSPGSWSATVSG